MDYTVKKLAKLSNITVRTLHHYDAIGLLKPAYHGDNGYRFYVEEQLLMLQQILFFRELGFELKKIQKIVGRSDFDKVAALNSHRLSLEKEVKRIRGLLETIDKTVDHLQGKKQMKDADMYMGFSKEKQAEYLEYLKNRLGKDHYSFAECEKNEKKWTKADFEKWKRDADVMWPEMARLHQQKVSADSKEVQAMVKRLYDWIKQFWTPNRESFIGLGQSYTEFEWKKFFGKYDPEHPKLALYLAEGMRVFAERELS